MRLLIERVLRFAPAVLLALALAAFVAPTVLADVDPASDVLLLQNVFLPYKPKTCSQVKDTLTTLTKTAKGAGYPIKVAVIGSPADLGAAPQYFGQPQAYARFLDGELGTYGADVGRVYTGDQPVLTVMPAGFGYWPEKTPAANALKGLTVPRNARSNELARATIDAIPKLAAASGHSVAAPKVPSGCSSGGSSAVLIFGAPLLLLLALGGSAAFRRLRPRAPGTDQP